MRDERPFAMKKRVFKAYEGSLRNAEGDASNERGVVVTPTPGEEELMTTQSRVVILTLCSRIDSPFSVE
jgi:hypothetical protein